MRTVIRRLRRLEQQLIPPPQRDYLSCPRDRFRIVVSRMDRTLNLESSSCTRMLTSDGYLMETIRLDGIRGGLTDEELDRFVERFPIQQLARPGRPNSYR